MDRKTMDLGLGVATFESQEIGSQSVPGHCPLNGLPVKFRDKVIDPCQLGCPYYNLAISDAINKRQYTCGKIAVDAALLIALTSAIPNMLKGLTGMGDKLSKHPLLGAFFKA